MKRRKLLKYLESNNCKFLREGGNHTVYYNVEKKKVSTIPRHNEINDYLIKKICKDLEIPTL
jgi:mRNA interferase HicA